MMQFSDKIEFQIGILRASTNPKFRRREDVDDFIKWFVLECVLCECAASRMECSSRFWQQCDALAVRCRTVLLYCCDKTNSCIRVPTACLCRSIQRHSIQIRFGFSVTLQWAMCWQSLLVAFKELNYVFGMEISLAWVDFRCAWMSSQSTLQTHKHTDRLNIHMLLIIIYYYYYCRVPCYRIHRPVVQSNGKYIYEPHDANDFPYESNHLNSGHTHTLRACKWNKIGNKILYGVHGVAQPLR